MEISLFTTTSRNVSVVRYGVSLVTTLLLDFEFSESHLGKTQMRQHIQVTNDDETNSSNATYYLNINLPSLGVA